MCAFFQLWSFENYTSKFRPHLRQKISCSFCPSPFTHLLLPSSSYPWLPMVVSFFLTHLLLEVASPIIFLPSPFCCHDLLEAKDSIDEEDPRPLSSTWSYVTLCAWLCDLSGSSLFLNLHHWMSFEDWFATCLLEILFWLQCIVLPSTFFRLLIFCQDLLSSSNSFIFIYSSTILENSHIENQSIEILMC